MPVPSLADTATLIRSRRTHKDFGGAPIDRAVLDGILELARWAPTHRLTQPWRFYVLDMPAIKRLMEFLRSQPQIAAVPDPEKGAAKMTKLLSRLPTVGALVQATWVRHAKPDIDGEDRAAAAAAIQNILLSATAAGLATYWSTNPALVHPDTLRWCGIDQETEGSLGCLWLGSYVNTPPTPPRHQIADYVRWVNA
jgi:nitroreductase